MNVDDLLAISDPWTPDNFQTLRYGVRYYCDPLPGCNIAPATDNAWPGFSSVKPSKPFRKSVEWVNPSTGELGKRAMPLDLVRALDWLDEAGELHLDDREWRQAFLESGRTRMNVDTLRGSAVHAYAEALLTDTPVPGWAADNEQARPYLTHVENFISTHVVDAFHIERVVIDRRRGYGGTGDAWLELRDGRLAYCDWKSRGADSGHGCYEEEIAQGGAYTSAEYMIVPGEGCAQRAPMPAADVGLVVSIRPDGWEAHEYDLGQAAASFDEMLRAHQATSRSGKVARLARKNMPVHVPQDRRSLLQCRIDRLRDLDVDAVRQLATSLTVAGIPTLKQADNHTPDQLDEIEALIGAIEDKTLPFGEAPADRQPTPVDDTLDHPAQDEGPDVSAGTYDDLRDLFDTLDPDRRTWVLTRAREALRAGVSVHMAERPSQRRWAINHALVACSLISDNDVIRELVAAVVGDDWPLMPAHMLGHVFGALTATEAEEVAGLAHNVAAYLATERALPLADTGRIDLAALAA